MGLKESYRPNFMLLLYLANILILFLVPFASCYYDGPNRADLHITSDFKVGFLGNWVEYMMFHTVHYDYTSSGSANEIGSYSNQIIPFMIVGLVFCFIGAIFIGAKIDYYETSGKRKKQIKILQIIGAASSILGSLFGIISLIFYSIFKNTIILPYEARIDGYPSGQTPPVIFAPGYIACIIIFLLFTVVGIIYLTLSIHDLYKNKSYFLSTETEKVTKNIITEPNEKSKPVEVKQEYFPYNLDRKTIEEKSAIIERVLDKKTEVYISNLRLATRLSDKAIIFIVTEFLDFQVDSDKIIKK